MAKKSGEPSTELPFDPLDPSIQDIFVDNAFVHVNNSEATITFSTTIPVGGTKFESKPSVRLHISHTNLILLGKLLKSRGDALEEAYGDHLPTLQAIDPEFLQKTMIKYGIVAPNEGKNNDSSAK